MRRLCSLRASAIEAIYRSVPGVGRISARVLSNKLALRLRSGLTSSGVETLGDKLFFI
jgi:hypothetical protein